MIRAYLKDVSMTKMFILMFVAAVLAGTESIQAADSAYTLLSVEENCIAPEASVNPTKRFSCAGYKDYQVFLGDDDGRVSLWFSRFPPDSGFVWQSFASFNYVNATVEWRLQSGQPFATISRWFVDSFGLEDSPILKPRNVLVVSKVAQTNWDLSCWVGVVDARQNVNANELARLVADKVAPSFDCSVDFPKIYGRTGPTTPYFSPSGGVSDVK